MKKSFLLIFILVIYVQQAFSQTKDTSLKLTDIQLSNAPAFSLLDVSPSSIETTPSTKAFAISIANAINQGNGIPQNYAFEVTPFWFFKHQNIDCYKYFGIDTAGHNKAFSHARFAALSFAIINNDSTTNVGHLANHNAALGLRLTLLKFYKKQTLMDIKRIDTNWHLSQVQILHLLQGRRPTPALIDSIKKSYKENYADSMKLCLNERPVFSLDIAAASSMGFYNNSFNDNKILRSGIWMNALLSIDINKNQTNRSNINYLNIYGICRYINSNDSLAASENNNNINLFDFGLKTELQFQHISLAYEYIRRTSSDKNFESTYKSVGLIHYKIKDGLFLTGALGQNFSSSNNLIATIGLNWGISNGNEKID